MSIISTSIRGTSAVFFFLLMGCATALMEPGDPGCTFDEACPEYARCLQGICVRGARDGRDAGPDSNLGEVIVVPDLGVPEDVGIVLDARPRPLDAVLSNDADVGEVVCVAGTFRSCGNNRGLCRLGEQQCSEAGQWGECEGGVMPAEDVCNGGDDDCDGTADEGFGVGAMCEGTGECGSGVVECAGGMETRCSTGPRGSASEVVEERCNGLDDDCDGEVDEDHELGLPCAGACGPGVFECNGSGNAQCSTDVGGSDDGAADERCDQRDNDCDGRVDETFQVGEPCLAPGRCGDGLLECDEMGGVRCSAGPEGSASEARPEACDGVDDDCDGRVDELLGVGMPCIPDAVCGQGTQVCDEEGAVVCVIVDAEGPADEVCNGRDDDCDEVIDEAVCGGDTCAERIPLQPTVTASGDTAFLANDEDRANCLGNVRGPDQFFSVEVPSVGRYVVGVAPLDAEFDPLFWVAPDCERAGNCLVADAGQDDDGRGRPEAEAILFPRAGRFIVAIGGRDEGERGPFAATFYPISAGETCADAIDLSVPGQFVGTTARNSADISARTCPAAVPTAGPDLVFRLELETPTQVIATFNPASGVRGTLMLTADCGRPDDQCRAGSTARAAGGEVQVSAELPAGVTYLVVDHPVGGQGPFSLSVTVGD